MATSTIPTYQTGLKNLRETLEAALPTEVLAVFDQDAAELEKQHTQILRLQAGDKAPDFTLSNPTEQQVKLSTLLQKGKVVLTFYRGSWCPYCNLQLNQYQQILSDIHAKGAELVAISPQTPDASLSVQEKNDLQFTVLSDPGNIVAKQFTTVFQNGKAPVETMKALGMDFASFYSDDSHEIPVPAVFIIDTDRTITFAKTTGGDYRNRVEASDILAAL